MSKDETKLLVEEQLGKLLENADVKLEKIDYWEKQRLQYIRDSLIDSVERIKKTQKMNKQQEKHHQTNNNGVVLNTDSFYELEYGHNNDGSYSIIGLKFCLVKDLCIPGIHKGNPVTGISDYAFSNCSKIEKIIIPDSVKKIGKSAFEDCVDLKEVILCNGLIEIGKNSFAGCVKLEHINLPESVTSIGDSVFAGCSALGKIVIPNSIKRIEQHMFWRCSSLKYIFIPEGVKIIESFAFSGCKSLANIVISKNVQKIGFEVFDDCNALVDAKFEKPTGWYGYKNTKEYFDFRSSAAAAKILRKHSYFRFYNESAN